MTTDEADLLRAVLLYPHEDTPRLIYADWLDEHAGDVACGTCKGNGYLFRYHIDQTFPTCANCGGSGRVSDGRRERAEFIRVQVELARLTCMRPMRPCTGPMKLHLMCMACQDATELRRRERELFRTHCDRWFPVPNGYGLDWGITLSDSDAATDLRSHYVVHRGFVKVVVCPISTWCGGQCVWCADWPGRGGSVGSAQPPWCPMCDSNTGRTPGIGRQVVAACPGLVEVRATDREPWHNSGAGVWVWLVSIDQVDPAASDRCRIPPALWPHLQPQEGRLTSAHPTRAAALAALSAALVELGRTRAGLSPA